MVSKPKDESAADPEADEAETLEEAAEADLEQNVIWRKNMKHTFYLQRALCPAA